eukprot:1158307-Pelagomonas_calceolata.AAC.9
MGRVGGKGGKGNSGGVGIFCVSESLWARQTKLCLVGIQEPGPVNLHSSHAKSRKGRLYL